MTTKRTTKKTTKRKPVAGKKAATKPATKEPAAKRADQWPSPHDAGKIVGDVQPREETLRMFGFYLRLISFSPKLQVDNLPR
ncbi:hypothetical protein CA54_05230 [Symmachiella macrocystis]|uniref:Uncharacterized protein n=1 Tax=Symmachiella macrocystis TaxID=2527985 RepID=A0A5C6BMI3_9PLAN|nr:hypothetical protein CA54_05230 [Symmachiella macrocystis]